MERKIILNLMTLPTEIFKEHTLEKSENALKTAEYILKIMEEQSIKEIFNAEGYDGTLWIINASYYRIFFLVQYLLALDNKKFPENTEDTHKMAELALMYYFIIKGSNMESKPDLKWEDIKQSRLSKALELITEAKEEAQELTQQRAKKAVNAELERARTSIHRAKEFGDIIKEYVRIKK